MNSSTIKCPNCGRTMPSQIEKCSVCGSTLRQTKGTTKKDEGINKDYDKVSLYCLYVGVFLLLFITIPLIVNEHDFWGSLVGMISAVMISIALFDLKIVNKPPYNSVRNWLCKAACGAGIAFILNGAWYNCQKYGEDVHNNHVDTQSHFDYLRHTQSNHILWPYWLGDILMIGGTFVSSIFAFRIHNDDK